MRDQGDVLMSNDEWLVGRSYVSQKSMATLSESESGSEKEISLDNNDKDFELIAA